MFSHDPVHPPSPRQASWPEHTFDERTPGQRRRLLECPSCAHCSDLGAVSDPTLRRAQAEAIRTIECWLAMDSSDASLAACDAAGGEPYSEE